VKMKMRMNSRSKAGALALAALTTLAACGGEPAAPVRAAASDGNGLLRVAVVHYPLAYFAEQIGGDAVEVVFPVPPNVDPAFWEPAPEDVALFQETDLILRNGAGYAGWTRTASLPVSRVIDTGAAFAERLIDQEGLITHSHGPEGDHAHGATAFTTWLDPELATLQAAAVRDALSARRPEQAEAFQARFTALEADLAALDARLAAAVAAAPERAVIFSHPVYDYLTRRYDIRGASLHWEPDSAPSADQWLEIEELAATHEARWLVWEGEPLPASVAGLRERGIESVVFDPCGNRPDEGDLGTVMAANAAALEQVFAAD